MMPFKPNKMILAYARLGRSQGKQSYPSRPNSPRCNQKQTKSCEKNSQNGSRKSENTLYQAIMGQLQQDQNHYINKLIGKSQKMLKKQNDSEKDAYQNKKGHERAKSYANIMLENRLHVESHETSVLDSPTQIMESKKIPRDLKSGNRNLEAETFRKMDHQTNPQAFKKQKIVQPSSIQTILKKSNHLHRRVEDQELGENVASESFLQSLDQYLNSLKKEEQSSKGVSSQQYIETEDPYSKTHKKLKKQLITKSQMNFKVTCNLSPEAISGSKQKQHQKSKAILHKLESQDKKITQLKLSIHLLKSSQKKGYKKTQVMKEKMYDMLEHIQNLEKNLAFERRQRVQIESFLVDFQTKASNIRMSRPLFQPERKTMGYPDRKKRSKNKYQSNYDDFVTVCQKTAQKLRQEIDSSDQSQYRDQLRELRQEASLGIHSLVSSKRKFGSNVRVNSRGKGDYFRKYESYEPSLDKGRFDKEQIENIIQSNDNSSDYSEDSSA